MLLALSNVTYVLIGWFKFLLLKFLYEYWPCAIKKVLEMHIFKDLYNINLRSSTNVLKSQLFVQTDGKPLPLHTVNCSIWSLQTAYGLI